MKFIYTIFLLITGIGLVQSQTDNPNLLINVHKASQSEIDAYDIADLKIGMLVYNTDENRIYQYTNAGFLEILTGQSTYVGLFTITATGNQTITGLPFKPSSITMVAHANVETLNIDSDNGVGNNSNTIANAFGTMNGFARQDGQSITQQVIYNGGNGTSINDISRYASSSQCVGLRYSNQNGDSLGKTTANLTAFTADGFTINVTENADNVVVLFTAYR